MKTRGYVDKWAFRRARWDAYKRGVRDRFAGRPALTEVDLGQFIKSYLEGYNESRPHKIAKYAK